MPLLEMAGITKKFPGVKALDNVQLVLEKGEVLSLLGENGAGKSTLMKILSGVYRMDSGEIRVDGKPVEIKNVWDAARLGIGIIHQELSLVPDLTVYENIFLGRESKNPFTRRLNKGYLIRESERYMEELGIKMDVKQLAKNLSVAEQQMVEIAKVLSMDCRIIIMDEPTDALTTNEVKKLFEVIRALKSNGKGIIFISHKIEEIFEIADSVEVLRDGRYIGTRAVKDTTPDELINMMVGRELKDKFPKVKADAGDVVLEVRSLSVPGMLNDINFNVKKGEVLGISGLMGAGRTELGKTLFGVYRHSGDILLEGKPINIRSPEDAIKAGIVYLTENRKEEGLFLDKSVSYNITLAKLRDFTGGLNRVLKPKERRAVSELIERLRIKTPTQSQLVGNLSGGNQQKVSLARWLLTGPKVLILDEPTRGIDIGAKVEIYNIINNLKSSGTAIIMISSELPEILGISDRIIVMHKGRITGELNDFEATQEKIMKYAVNL
ncbi:sugar ABC transporter ATP-binding protein [Calorimonas adulescens]|jgi:monosaccharide ABC transporter ATP-binding protein, CUT2 family (TC 3.A.1.2.-)|uniref:Sugar ABC transporter ATP-binding protein n=1 Tax=Calorimonas adulescens TaxID=2606906 RepID=A0A5D8QAA9_9THEO|nr:sugar ABC transporter ATP-binding protein [Calorimonas adulescens]TZE80288.1 sugar ABC transporter ATP-binding protein [Calorimonas adulescens]